VAAQFVEICRKLNLFTKAVVAIDGSKFKAVNNRDRNFHCCQGRQAEWSRSTPAYTRVPGRPGPGRSPGERCHRGEDQPGSRQDRRPAPPGGVPGRRLEQQVQRRAGHRRSRLNRPGRTAQWRQRSGDGHGRYQWCRPPSRREHHLIVAHEVTNLGHDRTLLEPRGLKAREATGCEEITALADRGYFNGDQVLACEGTGVLPCVPKTETSSGNKRGFFTRNDFIYDAEHDHYTCPAGAS